jgi:hypothetical protein
VVEVNEMGVVSAIFVAPDRWRLTWTFDDDVVRHTEGDRYAVFDALVDWGFSGDAAGEIIRELYGGWR